MTETYVYSADPSTVFYNPYTHAHHTEDDRLNLLGTLYSLAFGGKDLLSGASMETLLTHVANNTDQAGNYHGMGMPLYAETVVVPGKVRMGRSRTVTFMVRTPAGFGDEDGPTVRVDYFDGGTGLGSKVTVLGWMLNDAALERVEPTVHSLSQHYYEGTPRRVA